MATIKAPTGKLTPDEIRRLAEAKYGQAIAGAQRAYELELERLCSENGIKIKDVPYGAEYKQAGAVVGFIGSCLYQAGITKADHDKLLRICSAMLPPIDARATAQAVATAEKIVADYAEIYASNTADRERLARFLPYELGADVHEGFAKLRGKQKEISALLARFTTGKGRKTKDGEPSRLTSAGLVNELNAMAGWPLGRQLTAKSVGKAKSMKR